MAQSKITKFVRTEQENWWSKIQHFQDPRNNADISTGFSNNFLSFRTSDTDIGNISPYKNINGDYELHFLLFTKLKLNNDTVMTSADFITFTGTITTDQYGVASLPINKNQWYVISARVDDDIYIMQPFVSGNSWFAALLDYATGARKTNTTFKFSCLCYRIPS